MKALILQYSVYVYVKQMICLIKIECMNEYFDRIVAGNTLRGNELTNI